MGEGVIVMAPLGQTSWQQAQPTHLPRSSAGAEPPPAHASAFTGHAFAHFPQPMQMEPSIFGLTQRTPVATFAMHDGTRPTRYDPTGTENEST